MEAVEIRASPVGQSATSKQDVGEASGIRSKAAGDSPLLRGLVHHSISVDHADTLEQVQRVFAEHKVEYAAIVRDGIVSGICSRLRLGILFGSRYGFALHSRAAAHGAQIERPLVYSVDTPARDVIDRALARRHDEFHDDVALVDRDHQLIGLIPTDALARLQTRMLSEHVSELEQNQQELLLVNQALRESQGRYRGLFESHAIGVALIDQTAGVQAHNPRLAALLNIAPVSADLLSLAPWIAEKDRPEFLADLDLLSSGAAPVVIREYSFDIPGRGARQFRCSLGWIEATRQICACVEDVTEQRVMEREFLRREKQVLLDTLVGGIAHELNNKLTPVQGFSELIASHSDAQTRTYAELIGKSVAEAANIIRQLLQLSRPTATTAQTVDLRAVVTEALSMLRFQLREAQCSVNTSQPAHPIWVRVAASEIKQVVMNLALNGLQAMSHEPGGTLTLEINTTEASAQIIVGDTGVGIPPENLGRIFDPFFTTKGPERGSGLGLSVCFGIVRQHSGTIEVWSEPGAGARFTVNLPRALVAPQRSDPATGIPPDPIAETEKAVRVLVVDDEPTVGRLIQTVLSTRFGCDIDVVANGVEAFERLAVERYALVISDIRMPTMNGTELYLWLREAQPVLAERFVFITGYPGENHLEKDVKEWRVPVLTKPFSTAQLCATCAPFLTVPTQAVEVG